MSLFLLRGLKKYLMLKKLSEIATIIAAIIGAIALIVTTYIAQTDAPVPIQVIVNQSSDVSQNRVIDSEKKASIEDNVPTNGNNSKHFAELPAKQKDRVEAVSNKESIYIIFKNLVSDDPISNVVVDINEDKMKFLSDDSGRVQIPVSTLRKKYGTYGAITITTRHEEYLIEEFVIGLSESQVIKLKSR